MYIHELENWTDFRWDDKEIALLLDGTYPSRHLFGTWRQEPLQIL